MREAFFAVELKSGILRTPFKLEMRSSPVEDVSHLASSALNRNQPLFLRNTGKNIASTVTLELEGRL